MTNRLVVEFVVLDILNLSWSRLADSQCVGGAMGWPSTYENIRDRLHEAFSLLQRTMPEDVTTGTDFQRQAIDKSLSALAAIVAEAQSCLDIATDPSLDLAVLLRQARDDKSGLQNRCAEYETSCASLMRRLRSEVDRATAAEQLTRDLRAELNQTNAKIDKMMQNAPGAVYDAYMKGAVRKSGPFK